MAGVPQSNLHLDASGRLDEDLPCAQCGYNLRGCTVTSADGRATPACPECGCDIAKALRSRQLRHCDERWLRDMGRGAALVIVGVVACTAFGIIVATETYNRVPLPGSALLLLGGVVLLNWGLWLFTAPEPVQPIVAHLGVPAMLARALVLCATLLSFVVIWMGFQGFRVYTDAAAVGAMAMLLAGLFFLLLHAGRLAMRVPHATLARVTHALALALAFTAAPLLAIIFGFVQRLWLMLPGWSNRSVDVYATISGIVPKLYYALAAVLAATLVTLGWYSRIIRRQAR